ncbi:Hypothetical predicted protein, partial [Paramuricea clavata]
MKELWDAKGYDDFGFSMQNLRDQAARLDKSLEPGDSRNVSRDSVAINQSNLRELNKDNLIRDSQTGEGSNGFDISAKDAALIDESQYTNQTNELQTTTRHDLHNRQHEIPGALDQNEDNAIISGCLPDAIRENRKGFIDQITMHINDWNSGSENQHVSLKAVFVLLAVGLQKPNPKSKAKDHQDALSKRLALWKDGEISKLIREGRIIQSRIGKFKGSNHPDKAKVFAKLVLEGQINSALRFLSETSNGVVLTLTDDVMMQLKQKHPEPQPAKLGSVLFGPLNDEIPESVYSQINGEMVRQAALRTKGSGGPSGVDANGFRRMLACKSFKQSSTRLCEVIARMTKTLCTQYIDPTTIEALIASRLIPLDKGEGAVRPIGVGEVIRRISAKCVISFAKKDVVEASGSLQLCAGQKSGKLWLCITSVCSISDNRCLRYKHLQTVSSAVYYHQCNPLDRDFLALPARLGGLALENPSHEAEHCSAVTSATRRVAYKISATSLEMPTGRQCLHCEVDYSKVDETRHSRYGQRMWVQGFATQMRMRYQAFDDVHSIKTCQLFDLPVCYMHEMTASYMWNCLDWADSLRIGLYVYVFESLDLKNLCQIWIYPNIWSACVVYE